MATHDVPAQLSHIRAVALDFDGTLIEWDRSILPVTVAALRAAAARGVRIATASGRSRDNQIDILTANGLGPETGIVHALTCDERSVWLLQDGEYVPLEPWNSALEAEWERVLPQALELLAQAQIDCQALGVQADRCIPEELIRQRGLVGLKFASETEAISRQAWLAERVAAASSDLLVTQNWHLVHILAKLGGKGNSLVALCRHWGLEPREMVAVGDRNNDVPMLDGALGLTPACVGNAVPEIVELVRSQGGYVARAEVGRGVAEVVRQVGGQAAPSRP